MVPEKEILHGFVPNITHYGTSDYTVGVTGAYHPASTPELLPTTPHKVVCGSWSMGRCEARCYTSSVLLVGVRIESA